MTAADSDVLDEIYQELIYDLNVAKLRLAQAEAECESLSDSIRKLQESRDNMHD